MVSVRDVWWWFARAVDELLVLLLLLPAASRSQRNAPDMARMLTRSDEDQKKYSPSCLECRVDVVGDVSHWR